MSSLYEIIKSLQSAQGSIAKQAILDANKDDELFRAYMKAVYDVGINYYQKKLPKPMAMAECKNPSGLDMALLRELQDVIAGRKYTGRGAIEWFAEVLWTLDIESRELMSYIIDRKIGASVGDTMVLKTWPNLYFIPPYQRCSLLDKKARERFGKLKRFYVQTKADGSFAYVVKRLDGSVDVITRQGSKYPVGFAETILDGEFEPGTVLVGELLVGWWKSDQTGLPTDDDHYSQVGSTAVLEMYDRKTANGILNSVLKGGELEPYQMVVMQAWDSLLEEEFVAGYSTRTYEDRYESLKEELAPLHPNCHPVTLIDTHEVATLDEAFAIYQDHVQRGLEGCIIKDPVSLWKDGTAKDMVKLKIKFEVEMLCTGIYEGTGKYKGMMGGGYFRSKDGGIRNEAGSGFTDKQREDFWNNPDLIVDQVCALEANDITQSKETGATPSLSLPIFCEVRYDKKSKGPDTTERIYAQLEAAKCGS